LWLPRLSPHCLKALIVNAKLPRKKHALCEF
jgi:hypothetical protein